MATSNPKTVRRRAGIHPWLLALLVAACSSPPPAPSPPPVAPSPAPAPAAQPAPAAPPPSSARSVAAYKTEVARSVYAANSTQVFTGKPPPLLRSIVVVNVVVGADGKLLSFKVFRDNGDTEATNIALNSLKRASPFPQPSGAVARGGQVEYLESWLFRRDGKFQMRTLAEIQAGE